jgi:hypothetical protein
VNTRLAGFLLDTPSEAAESVGEGENDDGNGGENGTDGDDSGGSVGDGGEDGQQDGIDVDAVGGVEHQVRSRAADYFVAELAAAKVVGVVREQGER